MANDLQASISTNTGRTSAEIQRLQGTIASLRVEVDQLNKKCNDFQEKASRSFGHVNKEAQEMSKEMREGGHVMHMMGGEVGYAGERISSLARIARGGSTWMLLLAGAAGIAGLAIEGYNKYLEFNKDKLEAAIKAEERHYQAVMKGKEAAQKVSQSGGSEAETHRKMLGALGPGGSYDAHQIAGDIHADIGDVEKGLIETTKIPKSQRQAVIDAAKKAYLAGAGSFSEAISVGVSSPAIRNQGPGSELGGALVRERLLTGRFGHGDIKQLRQSIRDVQGNDATRMQNDITDKNSDTYDRKLTAYTYRSGAITAADQENREARNPEAEAMLQLQREVTISNEHLKKIADLQVKSTQFLGGYLRSRALESVQPGERAYIDALQGASDASDEVPSESQ